MSVRDLVDRLEGKQIKLWVDGDRLHCGGPEGQLSAEVVAELTRMKPELLEFLRNRGTHAAAWARQCPLSVGQEAIWLLHHVAPESSAYHIAFGARLIGKLNTDAFRAALAAVFDRHKVLGQRSGWRMARQFNDSTGFQTAPRKQMPLHGLLKNSRRSSPSSTARRLILSTDRLFARRSCGAQQTSTSSPLLRTTSCSTLHRWSRSSKISLRFILSISVRQDVWFLLRAGPTRSSFAGSENFSTGRKAKGCGTIGVNTCAAICRCLSSTGPTPSAASELPRRILRTERRAGTGGASPCPRKGRTGHHVRGAACSLSGVVVPLQWPGRLDSWLPDCGTSGRRLRAHDRLFRESHRDQIRRERKPDVSPPPAVNSSGDHRGALPRGLSVRATGAATRRSNRAESNADFQALFNLVRAEPHLLSVNELGLTFQPIPLARQEGQFEVALELFESGTTLEGTIRYDTDLFAAGTIESLTRNYLRLLEAGYRRSRPADRGIPVGSPSGIGRRRGSANQHRADSGFARSEIRKSIPDRFLTCAARSPHALAVKARSEQWSYAELSARASGLAARIHEHGSGGRVAVMFDQGAAMVAALMAVLMSGNACAPRSVLSEGSTSVHARRRGATGVARQLASPWPGT